MLDSSYCARIMPGGPILPNSYYEKVVSFLCCWSSRDFISASKDDEVDVLTFKKVTHCEQLAEKVRESHIGRQASCLKSAQINTTNMSFTCKSINTSHLMKVNTSTNLIKGIHYIKIYCTQIWCSLLTHVTIIMSWFWKEDILEMLQTKPCVL